MPITDSWLIPNHVILIEMSGDLTIEELQASANNSETALDATDHIIHQVIDLTDTKNVPNNIAELGKLSRPVNEHDMMGWVIVHGIQNKLIKFMVTMAGQLSNSQLKVVETRDDAIKFLQHIDSSFADKLKI